MQVAFVGLLCSGSISTCVASAMMIASRTSGELIRIPGLMGGLLFAVAATTWYVDRLDLWYF